MPSSELIAVTRKLSRQVSKLRFAAPVTHVYNPLEYARNNHEAYLERFARRGVPAVLMGMNPGPWGMAQTGIPFGEVAAVRDWMQLRETIRKPKVEHPKRPIQGLCCSRSEVSGRRVWDWAARTFETPEAFFERFFVVNWCPLAFMEESGRNLTPDKLPAAERAPLAKACDQALADIVRLLEPEIVVGVGGFARKQAERILVDTDLRFGTVLHPSPASPAANRGWEEQAERQLSALGLL